MPNDYRQIARGIILQDSKILLAKGIGKGNFFLPGGGIKKFESAGAALTREIKEELDTTSEIIAFLGIIENKFLKENEWIFESNYLFSVKLNLATHTYPDSKESNLVFEWKLLSEIEFLNILPTCLHSIIETLASKGNRESIWSSNF